MIHNMRGIDMFMIMIVAFTLICLLSALTLAIQKLWDMVEEHHKEHHLFKHTSEISDTETSIRG